MSLLRQMSYHLFFNKSACPPCTYAVIDLMPLYTEHYHSQKSSTPRSEAACIEVSDESDSVLSTPNQLDVLLVKALNWG